jgi:polyphenol oxidase
LVALPWSYLHQVHGADVVEVGWPGEGTGVDADALVSGCRGAALAVFTADCAPVTLTSPEGIVAVAHAGWKGAAAGVLTRTVAAMTAKGATHIEAALGPCIRAGCYEFGERDLDLVAGRLGDEVRSTTTWGTPSLDLAAAVRQSLARVGVEVVLDVGACTACSQSWFSHRAKGEVCRQATVVWLPDA